ncbi:MAG: Ti-type conjugative transfer relaxase TraA [Gammaproteobacteria bacterium]|nr:Ti-type conjugative transfer relaxase TraA [Gammaproteobacteria bacterium]
MAIYHMSVKPVRRATGRSAVAAAAYRSGEILHDARTDMTHDYSTKGGVRETGIILPEHSFAEDWALDRETLWNEAEAAERRKDAKTAQEFEVALPEELTDDQQRALVEAFAQELVDEYGCAADWAIHTPSRAGDQRNVHAHILITVRVVTPGGLGDKIRLERENGWLKRMGLPSSPAQVRAWRECWAACANQALTRAGHDVRIDHRSHADRGLTIQPTRTVGVHATAMARRGLDVERVDLGAGDRAWNLEALLDRAEDILQLVAESRSVFGSGDIERAIHRAVRDPEAVDMVRQAVLRSPALVTISSDMRRGSPWRYTTRRTVQMETELARIGARLRGGRSYAVPGQAITHTVLDHRTEMEESGGPQLSSEQAAAFHHVIGPERIALVAGAAGSGKSTMLAVARDAWERSGYRVLGAALAGKAVDGLQESSGIRSRTLSAWVHRWERGEDQLGKGDVLVIDEAGMLSSAQLSSVLQEVGRRGAKAVLAGDTEQLQAIGAGAPFRALAERCGVATLTEIRRQRPEWQRRASVLFSGHQTRDGLEMYNQAGGIRWDAREAEAMVSLAAEYTMHVLDHPEESRLALTHRRADVQALNRLIRTGLREAGHLAEAETVIETAAGERSFAVGDRIVFMENDIRLGVRNGSFGTVNAVQDGKMRVRLGGRDDPIEIDTTKFRAFDHGYATTIHKAQGATVDRAFVFAGPTMDRHLTYVAMTRHREDVTLHAATETFRSFDGLARKLSRSGLQPNALDYEGFLARRGLAGMLFRIGRGLMRGLAAALDRSEIPKLADTFLKFSGDEGAPPPERVLPNTAVEELQQRIAATEHARQEKERLERERQERERKLAVEQQRKQQELEKSRSQDLDFGFGM